MEFATMSGPFVICDLRPEWRRKPYVTFWRPDNAGYAYPLVWAGDYSEATILAAPRYYASFEAGQLIRFPVERLAAEALGVAPDPHEIDGGAGPVIPNNAAMRKALRKLVFAPALVTKERTNVQ